MESTIDWKQEYLRQKEYCVALEATRSDLWGVNEELRNKILSLEKGQDDLLTRIERAKAALSSGPGGLAAKTAIQQLEGEK